MDNIRFYEIDAKYVDYLAPYAPHLFHNSKKGQAIRESISESFFR